MRVALAFLLVGPFSACNATQLASDQPTNSLDGAVSMDSGSAVDSALVEDSHSFVDSAFGRGQSLGRGQRFGRGQRLGRQQPRSPGPAVSDQCDLPDRHADLF
jgi:hypothetical protein